MLDTGCWMLEFVNEYSRHQTSNSRLKPQTTNRPMALPYLVKHIYNSGTEEVIRRGKKIHALGNVELLEYDDLMATVVFRVKDDGYATFYKVHVNQFKDPKTLSLRCSCPYNLSEICRHKAGDRKSVV